MTALCSLTPAIAAPVAFDAQVAGRSDIVGLLDATGPVDQIRTAAGGLGTLGALPYFSADEVNLGTGQGVSTDGSDFPIVIEKKVL